MYDFADFQKNKIIDTIIDGEIANKTVIDYCATLQELESIELKEVPSGKKKVEYLALVIVDASDLYEIFKEVVKTRQTIPRVKHKGERTIKQIIYTRKDGGKVYIQVDPNYGTQMTYKDIQKLCDSLDIPFVNQGIGTFIDEYYQLFRKPHRVTLQGEAKEAFFNKCGNKCACGETKKLQIDHIMALANGGTNDEENLQLLCKKCHFKKTCDEKTEGYSNLDPIVSSFNNGMREIFDSDLMEKWAFCESLDDKKIISRSNYSMYGYDINKCYKNNLYYSKYEWPVFTVMDKPAIFERKIKCGFYYVETKSYFPLRGNGWYSQPMISYCLAHQIITMDDIKYQLIPSMTLPANHFQPFIDDVYSKFGDKYAKVAINSFIGCFYRREAQKIMSVYTRNTDEACHAFTTYDAKLATFNDELKLFQIIYEETTKFEENRSPLYLQILDMGALEAHQLSQIVGHAVFVKTDCIYSTKKVDISTYEWAPGVPKYKYENPGYMDYQRKDKYCRLESYEYIENKWNIIEDSDDFDDLAKQVINLGSCNIDGRAGSGKSTLIGKIKALLPKEEYACLAPTNKAARNIGGDTIHKKFGIDGKHISLKNLEKIKIIFVDEISMVCEQFYKLFVTIKNIRPDMKFVIVGDFKQLKPVKDRVKNCEYKESGAIFELCLGNRVQLTRWRRSDDDPMTKPRSFFPKLKCERSICFTNNTRIFLNEYWMNIKSKKHTKIVHVPRLDYDQNSQDMKVYVGLPIIARINALDLDIANNNTYTVKRIDDDKITLDDGTEIYVGDFAKHFYPAYSITTHKAQGDTFHFDYSIYEWDRMDATLRYVALTRGGNIKHINIV